MKQFGRRSLLIGMLFGANLVAQRAPAQAPDGFVGDAKVLEWNAIAVDTIGAQPPFPAARSMAITQLAVFEAVNAISQRYEPYLGSVAAPAGSSPEAAAVSAAHDVLAGLFPAAAAALDEKLAGALATLPDGAAKVDGVIVGAAAAALLLGARENDGSTPPEFYVPPDADPGHWQPTPSCSASGGAFLHWQHVEPFGVESASQFRAPPPFALGSKRYARDLEEVQSVGAAASTLRPQSRSDLAKLYAAQFPHVGWNAIARQLASVRHDGITETARALALLNASITDAHVTVFESKYHYARWRPETAIARAAEDGNPRTTPDAAFTPFIVAPCFPSYPSGHGVSAGAGSKVLAAMYGEGQHDLVNSTPSVPGVVLHYTRLHQIVKDVSDARVFGGIHFRNDQDAAEEMGRRIAEHNLAHLLRGRPDAKHCD